MNADPIFFNAILCVIVNCFISYVIYDYYFGERDEMD